MQQSWFQVSDNLISSTLGGGASPQIHLHITRDSQEDLDEELDSRQQKIQNWTRKEVFVRKQFEKNMAGTRIRNFDLTWPRFDPSPRSQGQIWLLLELQVVTQFLKKTSFVLTELKLGLTQGGLGAYPRGWFVYPEACARQLHSTPLEPARTWSTRENRFLQKKCIFQNFNDSVKLQGTVL